MLFQQLDELDGILFRQGRKADIDLLGWTDREFSCLGAILDAGGASVRTISWGSNTIQAI